MINELRNDIKEAMKQKNEISKSVLKSVYNKTLTISKETKKDIDNDMITKAVVLEQKQLNQTLESIKEHKDSNLYKETEQQLQVIEKYLPEVKSDEEYILEIRELIDSLPEKNNFGLVMKEVAKKYAGKVDMKKINVLVKGMLK